MTKKRIAIFGSTGSIGRQALEVLVQQPAHFELELLTALNNADLLISQALKNQPNAVVIGDERHYAKVREALKEYPIKVFAGEDSLLQILEMETIDMVLMAIVGFAGLKPTLKAIEQKKELALANKESLVVAGEIITQAARQNRVSIVPVDSEHSAIFQCLNGEYHNPLEKVYLTASGGPFLRKSMNELQKATPEEALRHPNWNMGDKVTIDSASLMNKGLEAIEARWLFDLQPHQIQVIIHPQSIIHSFVQFRDGSMKAQMSLPDMKLPIHYALAYPYRLQTNFSRFDFRNYPSLTFEEPDLKKFRNLALAFEALKTGGSLPCILNAANEIMVKAFLDHRIGFSEMSGMIEKCMEIIPNVQHPVIEDYFLIDAETRKKASELLNKKH